VQGTGEFVLSIPGVTAGTDVSNVIFPFGTTAGDNVASSVPEPSSFFLLVIGLAGLIGVARGKFQK
jgi:hypothetical protein